MPELIHVYKGRAMAEAGRRWMESIDERRIGVLQPRGYRLLPLPHGWFALIRVNGYAEPRYVQLPWLEGQL
jgi:hypothetical protein